MRPSVVEPAAAWPLGGGSAEADGDRAGGLADLLGELRDAARGDPERRAPDVDGGDDLAARVVDRGRDRVEAGSYSPNAVA